MTGPDDTERSALPHHLLAAAAALFDDLPDRLASEVGEAAAAGVEAARVELAESLEAGTELTVDTYRVRLAGTCPASAARDGTAFRWTPASAARHLGLRALALAVAGPARPAGRRPVEDAVRDVLAELVASGGERTPGPWLASLGPAGRATAQAQARRWAEQADAWLPLRLLDRRSLRFLDDDWWPRRARATPQSGKPSAPAAPQSGENRAEAGHRLVIHGRRDLTVDVGGRRVAVTMAGGIAGDPRAAGADALTALAGTLCDPKGRLVRVVRVHPASGEVAAVDVTPDLLRSGVAVVLRTAAALADAEAPAIPGPACTWCDRLAGCEPGTAWISRPERRSMGLPVPA